MLKVKMYNGEIRKLEKLTPTNWIWLADSKQEVVFDDGEKGIVLGRWTRADDLIEWFKVE